MPDRSVPGLGVRPLEESASNDHSQHRHLHRPRQTPPTPKQPHSKLIVRVPADVLGKDSPEREALQDSRRYCNTENCFAGMTWHDARHAASAIIVDAIARDDAAEFLRGRAERVLDGSDRMPWDDREAMARALSIGATALGL